MDRRIESELLDELPAEDRRAVRSRRDLRRINALMGNVRVLASALHETLKSHPPTRVADLGAGDGTLMLRLARRLPRSWRDVEVVLVDRQAIVNEETRRRFEALSWKVKSVRSDVPGWLAQPSRDPLDLVTANLFLHHFSESSLRRILRLVAEQTGCFVACEPRRYPAALRVSRWLWLIGCNQITRHDAVASVRAGFSGEELSGLWPRNGDWRLRERAAGLFSHCFVAHRSSGGRISSHGGG